MTTDQIIQCCYVVGLTTGLLAIARSLVLLAKAVRARPVAVNGQAAALPPMDPEKLKEQTDRLIASLREKSDEKEAQRQERHGLPPESLMRSPRYVSPGLEG